MCTGGRAGVRYVITKFSQMDSLPNFLTHGAPLSRLSSIMATLLSHFKTAQRRTTVIGYHFGFETVSVVAINLGCEIIKLTS